MIEREMHPVLRIITGIFRTAELGLSLVVHGFFFILIFMVLIAAISSDKPTVEKESALFLALRAEGLRAGGALPEAHSVGLKVRRSYHDREGQPLDLSTRGVPLGTLVFVKITVENTGHSVTNLAIVDHLPGGFEIENPRLGREDPASEALVSKPFDAEYIDMRDERIAAFGELSVGKTVEFAYAVRAVSAGVFRAAPATAEAMYRPAQRGRTGVKTVRIQEPWDPAP